MGETKKETVAHWVAVYASKGSTPLRSLKFWNLLNFFLNDFGNLHIPHEKFHIELFEAGLHFNDIGRIVGRIVGKKANRLQGRGLHMEVGQMRRQTFP